MRMILLLLVVGSAGLQAQAAGTTPPILGFPRSALAAEMRRESLARRVPSRDTLRALVRRLAAVPHEAGTERSRHVAELLLARFRAMGFEARIEQFEALMPRPLTRTLELVSPERFTASLVEPAVHEDPTSGQPDQLPTYNAYAADGDVTAELVYVNYGRPEDYRVLDSLGISVKGRIVIARYGMSWRGIKPKVAAEHGAVGCVIYSDPRDDGYWVDDVYPTGPMRPPGGVQRGSVMDMPLYPGDPLSPGWASRPGGGRRLALDEARTLVKIPVLPIGYGDALPLLRAMTGPVAPEAWRGALPITYHLGPGAARVHLAVTFDWRSRPLYDVIATVRGAAYPDEWVIYGNHHDAWVNGAEDPVSGQAALGETARAVASLLPTGWRPARTIVFAAWDGEEWGLLGSTEWAEAHADELRAKAVVYYNSDTNGAGWLRSSGSHSLERFIEEVARDVTDPGEGGSVLEAALAHRREDSPRDSAPDTTFTIGALGSGSDYTAFLDHLGLPSVNISYGGAAHAGIYHSIYDSYTFYERFLDTGYVYGVTEARTMATAVLRMADAPLLPFDFVAPARTYRKYADEVARLAAANDTTGGLDLGPLRAALDRLDSAAAAFARARAGLDGATLDSRRRPALAAVNRLLAASEQALADTGGLPRRPWFRHLVYAPGAYTGYGVKTLPGIREAVELRRPEEARAEASRVASAIDRYAELIRRAGDMLAAALR